MQPNLMRVLAVFIMVFCSAVTGRSAEPIPLWPNGAPGEKGDIGAEADTSTPGQGNVAGKSVIRLGNVTVPTITLYPAPPDKDTGAAVMVCPGGGYSILAYDLEGSEVCEWLNSVGVTGVLLKYRVPAHKGQEKYVAPLQDAQRALGLIRFHASDWHIDPKRLGILGFSAGGNLSAAASTQFERRTYEPVDGADQLSCRPDFTVLIYPAYLSPKLTAELAPEIKVTSNTPPAFLCQTEDDGVHVENSLYYYLALKNANVPVEMHLFAKGGHGYGLRKSANAVSSWPKLAGEWMRGMGVLQSKQP